MGDLDMMYYEMDEDDAAYERFQSGDYYDLDLDPSQLLPEFGFPERLFGCLWPTTFQFINLIALHLSANLLYAVVVNLVPTFGLPVQHLFGMLIGGVALHFTYGSDGLARYCGIAAGALIAYRTAAWMRSPHIGVVMSIACFSMLLLGELQETDVRAWHRMRGSMLIVTMKMVSVGFDVDAQRPRAANKPTVMQLGGYLMQPASCVFGPWIGFADYMDSLVTPLSVRFTLRWVLHIATNSIASLGCLIASNCVFSTLIADAAPRWLLVFRDAMSFRFSHYFVSYLGQALLVAGGDSRRLRNGPLAGSEWFGLRTTEPLYVEFPRSLVRVVVVWNRSMHFWLKTYVFRVVRPYGTFAAILSTYAVSALLHGLNFQLAAVLLSLGVFTYVEHHIRSRLAAIFNACVLATACRTDDGGESRCSHRYRSDHPYVMAFNIVAALLALWNLAYLGQMFAGDPDVGADGVEQQIRQQEEGYSYAHTLGRWNALHFCSHWLVLALYVCFKFV